MQKTSSVMLSAMVDELMNIKLAGADPKTMKRLAQWMKSKPAGKPIKSSLVQKLKAAA